VIGDQFHLLEQIVVESTICVDSGTEEFACVQTHRHSMLFMFVGGCSDERGAVVENVI
jgi:hypothetical protein